MNAQVLNPLVSFRNFCCAKDSDKFQSWRLSLELGVVLRPSLQSMDSILGSSISESIEVQSVQGINDGGNNQRVVVIVDASKEIITLSALKWALESFNFKPGDVLTLLGVLHQLNTPSTSSLKKKFPEKLLGSRARADPNSMFGWNSKIIEEEVTKKTEEYHNNMEILQIRKLCETKQIRFDIVVKAGSSSKVIAVDAARDLRATWIILDRQMKRDKKYFLDNLSCGISRIKRNNTVDKIRGNSRTSEAGESRVSLGYEEMIPTYYQDHHHHRGHHQECADDLFSLDLREGKFKGHTDQSAGSNLPVFRFDDRVSYPRVNTMPMPMSRVQSFSSLESNFLFSESEENSAHGFPEKNSLPRSLAENIIPRSHSDSNIPSKTNTISASVINPQYQRIDWGRFLSDNKEIHAEQSEHEGSEIQKDSLDEEKEFKISIKLSSIGEEVGRAEEAEENIADEIPVEESAYLGSPSENLDTKPLLANDFLKNAVKGLPAASLSNINSDKFAASSEKLSDVSESFGYLTCSICKYRSPDFGRELRWFIYAELEAATNNFSEENFISEGGFGIVHRGQLKEGQYIAVKQHKAASSQGEKEFRSEVEVLSRAQHRNLVMLLGFCSEEDHRLLVYEYVCNGSLDRHLYRNPKPLEWRHRMKIAEGTARGLRYLHEECRGGCIVHRDMRPNNILVTHDFEPRLGDFGLARSQHSGATDRDTRVVGTFGYLAPEYAESGKVSTKTDVYSYGVVLLELITGHKALDKTLPIGQQSLIAWARPLVDDRRYHDLIDPRLINSHDVHELYCMVRAAGLCLRKDPNARPTMNQVVQILEGSKLNQIDEGSPVISSAESYVHISPQSSESNSNNLIKSPPKYDRDPPQQERSSMTIDKSPRGRRESKPLVYADMLT